VNKFYLFIEVAVYNRSETGKTEEMGGQDLLFFEKNGPHF